MKTLYIHGLDSHPVPEKLEILTQHDLDVVALHMDYRNETNVYHTLRKYAQGEQVEFVVGSSLGGFLGYWLAQDLGLPCLLFNPAMNYIELNEYMPEITNRLCPARFVVIGAHDETVDPEENIDWFRNIDDGECYQRVVVCDWLEHQIDFTTFEEMTTWALKSYKLFFKNQ
jgi:predicted esterase YcpF (UPF0227 family)